MREENGWVHKSRKVNQSLFLVNSYTTTSPVFHQPPAIACRLTEGNLSLLRIQCVPMKECFYCCVQKGRRDTPPAVSGSDEDARNSQRCGQLLRRAIKRISVYTQWRFFTCCTVAVRRGGGIRVRVGGSAHDGHCS